MKCSGLEAEAMARRAVAPSTMTLLGSVRHLAGVERGCEEYARHVGHVDLLRERIEGRLGQ